MTLTKQNYFEYGNDPNKPVMSSSNLKLIRHGDGGSPERLRSYLENYDALKAEERYKFHLEAGKLLHLYLENPNDFIVADFDRPSEKIEDIVKYVFQEAFQLAGGNFENLGEIESYSEEITKAVNYHNYQPRWGEATRINKVIEEGKELFTFMCEAKDLQVLSRKEKEVLENIIDKWLVSPHYPSDHQVNWMREIPISWVQKTMWGDIECKSLIDKFFINYEQGLAIVEDIKTSSKPSAGFISRIDTRINPVNGQPFKTHIPGAFINFKYYRQLAFYRRAVRYHLAKEGFSSKEITVACRILVFETVPPYEIKLFEVPEEWLAAGDEEIDEAFSELMHYHEKYADHF